MLEKLVIINANKMIFLSHKITKTHTANVRGHYGFEHFVHVHNAFSMSLFWFFLFNKQNGHYECARVCDFLIHLKNKKKHDMKCSHCDASSSGLHLFSICTIQLKSSEIHFCCLIRLNLNRPSNCRFRTLLNVRGRLLRG